MKALDSGEPIVVRRTVALDIVERGDAPPRGELRARRWAAFQGGAELTEEELFRVTGDPRIKDLDRRRNLGATLNPLALGTALVGLASLLVVTPLVNTDSTTGPLIFGASLSVVGLVGAFWTAEESRAKLPQEPGDEARARAFADRYNKKLERSR
jgi:hypothetical protein